MDGICSYHDAASVWAECFQFMQMPLKVLNVALSPDTLLWTCCRYREVNDMVGNAEDVQRRALNVWKGILPGLGATPPPRAQPSACRPNIPPGSVTPLTVFAPQAWAGCLRSGRH